MIKFVLYTCFLQLFLFPVLHATIIKGRVTDDQGAPIGWAAVALSGTSKGTLTNEEGYYILDVPGGNHRISCQVIGYQTIIKEVYAAGNNIMLDFRMFPQQLEIAEVVIKANGEDPAYPIMRKVIAKKKLREHQISSLQTDIYLKGVLRIRSMPKSIIGFDIGNEDYKKMNEEAGLDSMGKGIIYLLEETAHYTFEAPGKQHTRIKSIRESGDPKGVGWATMPPVTDIYRNNIEILKGLNKRGFVSPAHDNAFAYYRYRFKGSYWDNGTMISKIQVIPKHKYSPLFKGYVYVVEDEWVFQSVDLVLDKESQIDMLDTLRLEQYYRRTDNNNWVIAGQVIYPVINIVGIDIAGSMATSYTNQMLNRPVDPGLFTKRIISSYDSSALDYKAEHWDSIRPVPLAGDEVHDFKIKDSLYYVKKKAQDSADRMARANINAISILYTGPSLKYSPHTFSISSLAEAIGYNTVEGLVVNLRLSWNYAISDKRALEVHINNRYGFGNTHYNPLFKAAYQVSSSDWKERYWRWEIQAGQAVCQINNDNPISPLMNTAYTLFAGLNYMKLYEGRLITLSAERHWGNGLSFSGQVAYDHRIPLYNTADYTFNSENSRKITSNQPAGLPVFTDHTAFSVQATISYQPGWKYILYPDYKMPVISNSPVFSLTYHKAIPGVGNSTSNFDKWAIDFRHRIPLKLYGICSLYAKVSGFINKKNVGLPDWNHIPGNRTFVATPYLQSFQLAPYYKFSNTADLFTQAHVEWNWAGWLSNKIPVLKQLNWYILIGSNALYINENNYYAEFFAGLDNIGVQWVRLGRLDFIIGIDPQLSEPLWGFRLGIKNL